MLMAGSWHFRQQLEVFLFMFLSMFLFEGENLKHSSHQLKCLEENVPFPKGSMWKTEQGPKRTRIGN